MKAKARQQRLLAQMSSSQKAFLSNPVNKNDIDAYKGNHLFSIFFLCTKKKIIKIKKYTQKNNYNLYIDISIY